MCFDVLKCLTIISSTADKAANLPNTDRSFDRWFHLHSLYLDPTVSGWFELKAVEVADFDSEGLTCMQVGAK